MIKRFYLLLIHKLFIALMTYWIKLEVDINNNEWYQIGYQIFEDEKNKNLKDIYSLTIFQSFDLSNDKYFMPFVEVINKLGPEAKLKNLKIIVTDDHQI